LMGLPTIRALSVRGAVAAIGLLSLAGCHTLHERSCHKPQPYIGAQSTPPLIIPPGLDPPDTTNVLKIPQLNEPAPPPRSGKEPCLDEPPPFNVPKPAPAPQA
jgi:uncharacterized lipoprotein